MHVIFWSYMHMDVNILSFSSCACNLKYVHVTFWSYMHMDVQVTFFFFFLLKSSTARENAIKGAWSVSKCVFQIHLVLLYFYFFCAKNMGFSCWYSYFYSYKGIKGAWSFLFSFFSKLLRFWYHKNRHIFLIIILKFHALIPLRLEENCKNSPILLICC